MPHFLFIRILHDEQRTIRAARGIAANGFPRLSSALAGRNNGAGWVRSTRGKGPDVRAVSRQIFSHQFRSAHLSFFCNRET